MKKCKLIRPHVVRYARKLYDKHKRYAMVSPMLILSAYGNQLIVEEESPESQIIINSNGSVPKIFW